MLDERAQAGVTDISRVVQRQSGETAVALVVSTEPREAVVRQRTQSQLDVGEPRKQNRQTLQRPVVDVAEASSAPAQRSTRAVE